MSSLDCPKKETILKSSHVHVQYTYVYSYCVKSNHEMIVKVVGVRQRTGDNWSEWEWALTSEGHTK